MTQESPPPLRKLNRSVPPDLETIINKAIAREPGQRYATAGALAEDLRRFIEGRPILARRVPRVERAWRWCKRNRVEALLIGGIAAALILGAAAATVFAIQSRLNAADARNYAQQADDQAQRANAAAQNATAEALRADREAQRRQGRENAERSAAVPRPDDPGSAGLARGTDRPDVAAPSGLRAETIGRTGSARFRVVLSEAPLPVRPPHLSRPYQQCHGRGFLPDGAASRRPARTAP